MARRAVASNITDPAAMRPYSSIDFFLHPGGFIPSSRAM